MIRILAVVFLVGATAWAELPNEPIRAPVDFQEPREQEIEDLISRQSVYDLGYKYDHFRIWSVDPNEPPWGFDLQLQAWYAKLNGPLSVGGGEAFDLASVFGLDERTPSPSIRAQLWYERIFLVLDGYGVRFDGTQRVQDQIDLPGGIVIPVDETINSRLDITNARLAFGGSVVTGEKRKWYVDLFAGLNIFWFDFEVEVVDSPIRFDVGAWIPVPVLGVTVGGNLGNFIWNAELSGIGFSLEAFGAEFWDARVSVGWQFTRVVAVRVGFRYTDIAAQVESIRLDLELDGGFVQLDLNF